MLVVIHKKPSARQSQPIGFSGRLEAIRAPTSGKTKKSPEASRPPVVRSASQLLGTCAERASTSSGTLATNKATDKPHNDHASQEATRALNSPVLRSRSCRVVLSVTTPLYRKFVYQSLRQTLRGQAVANFLELRHGEVRRIHLPRTPVNKGKKKGRGMEALALNWRYCRS